MNRVLRASIMMGVLTVSSVCIAQESAPSAEDIKSAAEEFDLGRRSFKVKEYVEAAEHFESADQNAPSAAALELAIRSRDRAGQLERAATLSALAAKRHPEDASLRGLAESILKRARAELHEAKASCNTACDMVVDNKIVHGHSATEWTVFFDAGNHVMRAGWPGGRTVNEEIAAVRGGSSETNFEEPPEEKRAEPVSGGTTDTPSSTGDGQTMTASADAGVSTTPKGWSPVVFFTGVGVTAVLGGLSAWSGIDTQNNPGKDKVRAECAGQGESCGLYQDGLDKQRRTNIMLAATGVAGVATALIGIFATDWSGKAKTGQLAPSKARAHTSRAGIEPWVSVHSGATIGASGRF